MRKTDYLRFPSPWCLQLREGDGGGQQLVLEEKGSLPLDKVLEIPRGRSPAKFRRES